MRLCFRCKTEKPPSEFHRSRDRGYQRECKDCTKVRRAEWWKSPAGKESARKTKLKARFGITDEQYQQRFAEQDGKCAICGARASCLGHRLAVDHDHQTQKIRGLLCKACNVGIGNLQDCAALCLRAAEYLSRLSQS